MPYNDYMIRIYQLYSNERGLQQIIYNEKQYIVFAGIDIIAFSYNQNIVLAEKQKKTLHTLLTGCEMPDLNAEIAAKWLCYDLKCSFSVGDH